MATHPIPNQRQEEDEMLSRLREMLRQGDVAGARAFVQELERERPETAWVRHYARVLAPPLATMREREPSSPHDREYAWLQEHAAAYPGCWLAVLEDQLIAADPDFGVVVRTVRQTPGAERALLYFQPGAAD